MKNMIFRTLLIGLGLSLIFTLAISSPAMAESITLYTTSGAVDTVVLMNGSGFNANTSFQTYFAYGTAFQVVVGSGVVSSTGTLTGSFTVPVVPAGTYTIWVQSGVKYAVTSFVVTSSISLNVSSSIVGNQVTVTGTGFSAQRAVTIQFQNMLIATTSTNSVGKFSTSFTIPESFAGAHVIAASDGVYTSIKSLSVLPSMTISPVSGTAGTVVAVSGTGFGASRSIRINYDGVNIASVPSTVTTNNVGNFNATFTVPAGPARTVQVSVSDSTNVVNTPFKVAATVTLTPETGKVGIPVTIGGTGFNANRQVILTFDDEQVRQVSTDSVGSFTTSFDVPAATGGQHPVTANDGVRSVSTTFNVNNNLVVTPDSGKVGTPVNITGSGFRASRTANIYFDEALLATTQTSADGSFSTTFTVIATRSGNHTISVSDGAYAASSNFIIQPDVVISQKNGEMGAQVNISGTGFDAGRKLIIRLGMTQLISATTDANGSFSNNFTVPQLDVGNYNLNVDDGVNTASVTFTITASFNITPVNGYVGGIVTVQGNGYSGKVTIKYDDVVVATALAGAEGSFSTTFVVPASVHGYHMITSSDAEYELETVFSMESVPPTTPIAVSPLSIVRENARPTFSWYGYNDPSGVTYILQIANDSNFSNIVLEKSDLIATQYEITGTDKLETTDKETPYYWRVKAVDHASNESQWSNTGSFYVSFMADWLKYTLITLGALIGVCIVFWLGMITGRRGWINKTSESDEG